MLKQVDQKPPNNIYASIDLGSNSFHLLVAELIDDGSLRVIDRIKEPVQLAKGLNKKNIINKTYCQRGYKTLEKFSQRLKNIPKEHIRAVGTNTLRIAKNSDDFLKHGNAILQHPIEVIGGHEEARLIYVGVSHATYTGADNCLITDIGGGSTEVIIGKGLKPIQLESLYMGCVSYTKKFFPDGIINSNNIQKAKIAVQQELAPIKAVYRQTGWQKAIGSSGTILTIAKLLSQQGKNIQIATLDTLTDQLIQLGSIKKLLALGLPKERCVVLPGGAVILSALMRELGIEKMLVSSGTIREGVIHDLIGRSQHTDMREQTVTNLLQRFSIATEPGIQVANEAKRLFTSATQNWDWNDEELLRLMDWSARLHTIGTILSHIRYHKHGEYFLLNADLAGFSKTDQEILALLVGLHRRKISIEKITSIQSHYSSKLASENVVTLVVIFRLAFLLCRTVLDGTRPNLSICRASNRFILKCDQGWLKAHPLTRADLEEEQTYLKAISVTLTISEH